jgi:uncharacterized protein (TIGR02391 family)
MDKSKAIELLKEALAEIPHLRELHYDNQEFELWYDKVQNVTKAALDSDDARRFASYGPIHLRGMFSENVYQEDYLKKLEDYETALKSIIQKYELLGFEKEPATTAEPEEATELPIFLFDKMKFHPRVVEASRSLFQTRHYAQAIFEAFKAVENFVQDKSDSKLYGTNLMETVFNEENPIIKVPEAGHYYKDVQRGFKHLFIGAAQAIRNPKAHKEIIQKDPFITPEYLGFPVSY